MTKPTLHIVYPPTDGEDTEWVAEILEAAIRGAGYAKLFPHEYAQFPPPPPTDEEHAYLLLAAKPIQAIASLENTGFLQRKRTSVCIPQSATAGDLLGDMIASYHVCAVRQVPKPDSLTTDHAVRANVMLALSAALTGTRTYQWQSNLTYMELRIARLLTQEKDTNDIATMLSISAGTVRSHISNMCAKLGLDGNRELRSYLVAYAH